MFWKLPGNFQGSVRLYILDSRGGNPIMFPALETGPSIGESEPVAAESSALVSTDVARETLKFEDRASIFKSMPKKYQKLKAS